MSILPVLAGALALALTLAFHPGPAALAAAAFVLGSALLPTPRRFVVLAVAGLVLVLAAPAWAQAAAAPAPTWGLWSALGPTIDQGAEWLIGAALSALSWLAYAAFRHALPAIVEARLRETMRTGAHLVVLEVEQRIEASWTPERRKAGVDAVVEYAMDRMPWAVARLKLTQRAVSGMALKMLDGVIAGRGPAAASLPGAPLALAGSILAAGAAPTPCATCGATDAERLARGCVRDGCPLVPADPAAGLAAAAGAALSLPATLIGGGLAPTGG